MTHPHKTAQTDAHAPLINALKAHDQTVEDLQDKLEAHQLAMSALHVAHVIELSRMTPQTKKASAPLAGCLIDWVTAFERDGHRIAIWRRFGAIDVPIARATMQIQTVNGPIELLGELSIVVHSWVTESGFYRHSETFGGHLAFSSEDKLEDADDLISEIHPELLRQYHDALAAGKVWQNIADWVGAQTEQALKDS